MLLTNYINLKKKSAKLIISHVLIKKIENYIIYYTYAYYINTHNHNYFT